MMIGSHMMGRAPEAEGALRRIRDRHRADADAAFLHARSLEAIDRDEEAIGAWRAFLDLYEGPDEARRKEARDRIEALEGVPDIRRQHALPVHTHAQAFARIHERCTFACHLERRREIIVRSQ